MPSLRWVINSHTFLLSKINLSECTSNDVLVGRSEEFKDQSNYREAIVKTKSAEFQLNTQPIGTGVMVLGADIHHDDVKSKQFSDKWVLRESLYAQYEQRLMQMFKITIGSRYDREEVETADIDEDLSMKFGLNFSLSRVTHFR